MDSSKRALYKPAPVENVGAKQNRKALAQGHLMNESMLPESLTVFASPAVDQQSSDTLTTISHNVSQLSSGTMIQPRQSMASLSRSNQTLSLTDALPGPSRSPVPHSFLETSRSPPRSPAKPVPTNVLELSDSDREYATSSRTPIKHATAVPGSPVLLIDASGHRKGSNQTEVEVSTSNVKSPAKVICHAPSIVESDLRNTGYTEEAARVSVDSVPTVTVLSDVDLSAASVGQQLRNGTLQGTASLHVTRESTVASNTMAESDAASTSTLTQREQFAEGDSVDTIGQITNNSSELGLPGNATPAKSISESKGMSGKKKKVKGKFVQSRYMQSLSKPAVPTSSDVSGGSKASSRNITRPSSSLALKRTNKSKSVSTKTAPVRATTAYPSSHQKSSRNASHFSYTPNVLKGKHFASTPAADTSTLPGAPHFNASAIQASASMIASDTSVFMHPDTSKSMASKLSETGDEGREKIKVKRKRATDSPAVHSSATMSPGPDSAYVSLDHKQMKQVTQRDLDLMYARYIQAVFLDTKMRKIVGDKEKEAMSQMYMLWKENENLARKKSELEMKLAKLKHANMLDHQLEIQQSGLGPVTSHLTQFSRQYSTLAHALDTTRHQIQLSGILLPDDEDGFHDSLEAALNESEQLLGEISAVTQAKSPKVVAFASAISMLENAVANEARELKRCQELLAATSSLSTHETSLRVQQIEQRGEE